MHNKALVRMQTTLLFVCTAQLGRKAEAQGVQSHPFVIKIQEQYIRANAIQARD